MAFKIMVVDDEELARATIQHKLASEIDLELTMAASADEALRIVKADPYGIALILLDLKMPGKDGVTAAKELLAINPHLIIAISSGDKSREALKTCIATGVADFIDKDTDPAEFRGKVRSFCKKFEETAQIFQAPKVSENGELLKAIGVVGKSQVMADVATLVQRVASTDCTALICGESGVGKELIARAIHKNSPRRTKPFVAINMGAIPENLAESDLFGHMRGSFTGADQAKVGKLKVADGGTVFLDEIGDMKHDLHWGLKA